MFSEFFIDKPRFAGVISIVMILLGLLAIAVLPVSQYPQITPPQIVVSTTYPGASAQVVIETVAVPVDLADLTSQIWEISLVISSEICLEEQVVREIQMAL